MCRSLGFLSDPLGQVSIGDKKHTCLFGVKECCCNYVAMAYALLLRTFFLVLGYNTSEIQCCQIELKLRKYALWEVKFMLYTPFGGLGHTFHASEMHNYGVSNYLKPVWQHWIAEVFYVCLFTHNFANKNR